MRDVHVKDKVGVGERGGEVLGEEGADGGDERRAQPGEEVVVVEVPLGDGEDAARGDKDAEFEGGVDGEPFAQDEVVGDGFLG